MVRERVPQMRGTWNKGMKGSRNSGEGNYYIKGIVVMRKARRWRSMCEDIGEV